MIGFKVTGPIDRAGRDRAIAETKRALAPAPREVINQAMVRCMSNCAVNSESDKAKKLRWNAMLDDLCTYPGDVVLHALNNWHRSNEWFPTTSKIIPEIEKETAIRRSLLDCLKRAPIRGQRPVGQDAGRNWNDYSDEEKAAHNKRSAELLDMLRGAGKRMGVSS